MASYVQRSFVGGMNLSVDDTRLGENEYKFAKNVRNRFGTLEGVKNAKDISSNIGAFTSGQAAQGIYAVGEYVFIFFNGGCKYRKPNNPDTTWSTVINPGTLDRSAEIFVQAVPASTQNFLRKETQVAGASLELDTAVTVQRTVASIIVQDGINKPKIIEIVDDVVTDRTAKTYAEWQNGGEVTELKDTAPTPSTAWQANQNYTNVASTSTDGNGASIRFMIAVDSSGNPTFTVTTGGSEYAPNDSIVITDPGSTSNTATVKVKRAKADDREYIPIGRQMAFYNNKLFLISPNGTEIYHSASGRPLDFVVATDDDGNKINTDETIGGAPGTSYTVGYNEVTALKTLNSDALLVSTKGGSYAVSLDYSQTVFGEPFFNKQFLFTANSINQKSFIEMLGDFAFIDPEGLRSFNAVQQSKNEARNSVFSLKVARLFKDVVQTSNKCAAISFDDYALFACNTIYGHGILVFDILTQQFVSFDQFTDDSNSNIGAVIEFAKVETNNRRELFAITHGTTTSSGEPVYKCVKLYEGTNFSKAYLETKAFCTFDTRVEQKPRELRLLYNKIQLASAVTAIQRVNDEVTPDSSAGSQTKSISAQATPVQFPVKLPVNWSGPKRIQNLLYNFQNGQQGWKISYALQWTNGVTLSNIQIDTQDITPMNPMLSQAYVS